MDTTSRYVFMHVHAVPKGCQVAEFYLDEIIRSGLAEHIRCVYLGVVGESHESVSERLITRYPELDIRVTATSEDEKHFEFPTLNAMWKFSRKIPGAQVLYFHTKGTMPYGGQMPIYHANWRKLNTHFLMRRHEECFLLLEKYVVVGAELHETQDCPFHIQGNFWWARTDYISTLFDLGEVSWCRATRHFTEYWIASKSPGLCCGMHRSGVNHYKSGYPEVLYEDVESREYVLGMGGVVDVK